MGTTLPKALPRPIIMNKSRQECAELIAETSKILRQHRIQLKVDVRLEELSLTYDEWNWMKSTVRVKARRHPEGLRWEESQLTLEQIMQIGETLRQLGGQLKEEDQLREKPLKEKREPTTPTTPTGPVGQEREESVLCCICFEKKPKTVLPCSHSYCRECAVKFVAEQEDHRCPQCRMEYEGSPDAIESSFFQVYEEDGPLYQQARAMVIGCLAQNNPQIFHQLQP